MNKTVLIGNLVDAPELRFTTAGLARGHIRIAVNERRRKSDGEWREDVHLGRVVGRFGGTRRRVFGEGHAGDSGRTVAAAVVGDGTGRTPINRGNGC